MADRLTTIPEALAALATGEITAEALVQDHLDRIDAVDAKIQAVLTRMDARALAQARAIDEQRKAGAELGTLAGLPFTAKDMFLIEGVRTTAASKILDEFIAPYTGTAVTKLEAAGAICIAKVNQDEFAHGGSTEYSGYGPSRNPHNTERVPGGSSGGSAAALAAGIGVFSIGTDTGGSIRQPAAYCGVVGLKPTYGAVSRYGVVSMASSLDVIGPFAHTAADAAMLLDVMAGQDANDATTITLDTTDTSTTKKAAVVKEYLEGLQPAVAERYQAAFQQLREAGWEIDEVSLPDVGLALPAYYVVTPAEISSNLERYDGVRYGASSSIATDLEDTYRQSRGQNFGPEVQRRILTGTYALSAGYYDAYYKKAMQVRTLIAQDFERAFESYDLLIGPTAPTPAFAFGENTKDPVAMYLADIMTVAANLVGIPAISLPIQGIDGLPLGLQIMAPQRTDRALLAASASIEHILATNLEPVQL